MAFHKGDVGFHQSGHFLHRVNKTELEVLHRGVEGLVVRLAHLVLQQFDGNLGIVAVAHQGSWPDDHLLRRAVAVLHIEVGRLQACLIQLLVGLHDFGLLATLGRVDELIVDILGVGTELIEHLLGLTAQLLEACREVTIEIDLEIDIVIKVVENLLRRGRKGIAFLARQVEAGEQEGTCHINDGDYGHQDDKGEYLSFFQTLAFVFHHSILLYHLRLDNTSFVAPRNSAMTLKKYKTSRVSTTPRLNEL